jgi:hypothetical protein
MSTHRPTPAPAPVPEAASSKPQPEVPRHREPPRLEEGAAPARVERQPEQRLRAAQTPKPRASANHYHLFDESAGSVAKRMLSAVGKAMVDCVDKNLRAAGDALTGQKP